MLAKIEHTYTFTQRFTNTHTHRLKNRHRNKIKTQNPLLACSVWCIGLFSIISLPLLLISYTHTRTHTLTSTPCIVKHTHKHTHGTAFPGTEEERLILLCCRKIPRNPSTRHDATALMTRCPDQTRHPTPPKTPCVCVVYDRYLVVWWGRVARTYVCSVPFPFSLHLVHCLIACL